MKIILLLFFLFIISQEFINAQNIKSKYDLKIAQADSIVKDSVAGILSEIEGYIKDASEEKCKDISEFKWQQWAIVFFMPATMLLFALIFTFKFRNSKELKFSRLIGLSENVEEDDKLLSTSRFIALLTGMTAIFVTTTLIMYYGYIMVAECNTKLPLGQLWTIIAGLGIGVVPYGINVWNRNNKEKPKT